MTTVRENRRHKRRDCPEAMTVKYTHFNQDRSYKAKLRNMSDGGVFITCRHALKKGNILTMHFTSVTTPDAAGTVRPKPRCTLALAEVQWVRPLADDPSAGYEVGARYLFPMDV